MVCFFSVLSGHSGLEAVSFSLQFFEVFGVLFFWKRLTGRCGGAAQLSSSNSRGWGWRQRSGRRWRIYTIKQAWHYRTWAIFFAQTLCCFRTALEIFILPPPIFINGELTWYMSKHVPCSFCMHLQYCFKLLKSLLPEPLQQIKENPIVRTADSQKKPDRLATRGTRRMLCDAAFSKTTFWLQFLPSSNLPNLVCKKSIMMSDFLENWSGGRTLLL